MSTPIQILKQAGIDIVWFDSLGAKSMCITVDTGQVKIIIDPGVAEMQPSYPLPQEEKMRLRKEALHKIYEACRESQIIVITHYHYDHHVLPSDPDIPDPSKMFLKKKIIMKCPNKYINNSQWERARLFIEQLLKLVGKKLSDYLIKPQEQDFEDPCEKLSIALSKDFGDYNERRRQLLREGKKWFTKLSKELWSSQPWVSEIKIDNLLELCWGDSRKFIIDSCEISVLEPWFHGVEYDRTGWVTPLLIKNRGFTIFYTSDLMGPIIEDYAEYIAKLRPDIVILDGPPTYLFPYMFNRINLQRAVNNALTIISSCPRLVIYDHHLLRERKWRERVKPVLEEAAKRDVLCMTAAEVLGKKPLIDLL